MKPDAPGRIHGRWRWWLRSRWSPGARTPPEQAVRQQIEAMQAAIDARDAGAVDDLLADDFIGEDGLDRQGARATPRRGPVPAVSRHLGEARSGDGRTARASAMPSRVSTCARDRRLRRPILPDSGQAYQVETGWRLVDGEWKLLSASWTPKL